MVTYALTEFLICYRNGTLLFPGLSPGQYFLRPVMKEYSFEPPSQMIEVTEGSHVDLTVLAVRIAFRSVKIKANN